MKVINQLNIRSGQLKLIIYISYYVRLSRNFLGWESFRGC